MRIIDSHLHVWSSDFARYPFEGREELKQMNASAEFLLRCMDAAGVSGAVIVQPITYRWDHRYVTECLQRWRDRFRGMCLINPCDPNAPQTLERLVTANGYCAVRINPNLYPQGVGLDSDLSDRILEKAAELGIAVGFLIYPEHFEAVDTLLTRHPRVNVIIDHFGHCHTRDGGPETNVPLQKLLAMARHPRLHVKLSEFPRASSEGYPYRDLHSWTHALLRAFGAQRLMWGTDFPFIIEQCGYTRGLTLLSEETPGIASTDMEWLLGKTAEKVFGEWEPRVMREA
ncbi:MAG: amidohydrolase [Abditibacteriales bacterium]|nr:amidohydrolase [Abditibacteriales bacterium]MDW8368419.1 amidohydrolase family protein [Abditibacteriales bacterium]